MKVILVVDIFLGLAAESREAISSLGVLNSDIEEQFVLDRDALDGEGLGRNVCCALNKSEAFAVSHQIADVYDQVHRLAFLN